ncbi:MAG: DUF4209 domain-containing protein [Candidatus Micrarchaeota archaeon]|nr:DUF4209 domain-containing protein [Candidatus Micrarchaeota archaeon]
MDISKYNQTSVIKLLEVALSSNYERMFPFEIERELGKVMGEVVDNKDVDTQKKILWEVDLLNRTFGHVGQYKGQEVTEISNKWKYYLGKESGDFGPLSNPPFCEWSSDAVDYYKIRYEQTTSPLSKARYAFAIMTFSTGKEHLDWMKKSIEGWLETAEKYINDGKYPEYYEIPPLAYDIALKLSLSINDQELSKRVFSSLHHSIIKLITGGEKRWQLELFQVEARYLAKIQGLDELKKESAEQLDKCIADIEKTVETSRNYHFLRSYLELKIRYSPKEKLYDLHNKIAESHINEGNGRGELLRSSFCTDAAKKYQSMLGSFPEHKDEIKRRINELTSEITEMGPKIRYKQVSSTFEIKKAQIDQFLKQLTDTDSNPFKALIDNSELIPSYEHTLKSTLEQKKESPLLYIFPVVVSRSEEPVLQISQEEDIFDYWVRKNTLLGMKIGELMLKYTLEEMEREFGKESYTYIDELLDNPDLDDIKPTLKQGFNYIFSDKPDFIAGVHILMPYFEEILRRTVRKAGKVDLVLRNEKEKYFRSIELGSLLSKDEIGELIGVDLQKTLKVALTDNDQANLRNDLLHGKLESAQIIEGNVKYLAYCLLKLIKILKNTTSR